MNTIDTDIVAAHIKAEIEHLNKRSDAAANSGLYNTATSLACEAEAIERLAMNLAHSLRQVLAPRFEDRTRKGLA